MSWNEDTQDRPIRARDFIPVLALLVPAALVVLADRTDLVSARVGVGATVAVWLLMLLFYVRQEWLTMNPHRRVDQDLVDRIQRYTR